MTALVVVDMQRGVLAGLPGGAALLSRGRPRGGPGRGAGGPGVLEPHVRRDAMSESSSP